MNQTKVFYWFLLLFTLISIPAWGALPGLTEQALQARLESILLGAPWPGGEILRPICATPIFVEFNASREDLTSQAWQKILSPEFHLPRPTGLDSTYDSPSGHFRIHYAITGNDAVYQPLVDINPLDGVPDYVNLCGTVLDSSWLVEVNQLGFTPPPSDSFYILLPGFKNNGGDGKYDVYLDNIASTGTAGYTAPETTQTLGSRRWTSYVVLRNDYSIYGGAFLELLRATAAHEFFHTIQFGLDVYEYEYYPPDTARFPGDTLTPFKLAWLEMSAVWAEEQVYDNINDYQNFLPSFLAFPWLSLKTFTYSFQNQYSTGYHPYGSCLWPIFLSERFGTDIIRSIWNKCGQYTGDNVFNDPPGRKSATRDVLDGLGIGFEQAFREFTVWNFFTASRTESGFGYSEGVNFGAKIDSFKFYPVANDTIIGTVDSVPHPPQNLGSNYLVFAPNPLDTAGGLYLSFQGIDNATWLGTAVPHANGSAPTLKSFSYNSQSLSGQSRIYNWKNYDEIIMVLATGNPLPPDDYRYTYQVFHDPNLSGTEAFADAIGDIYPNPFRFSEVSAVSFPVFLSGNSFCNIDIFTVGGELVKKIRLDLSPGDNSNPGFAPSWDGKDQDGKLVSSGIYICKIRTKNATVTKKLAVIR
jgi:hypothetical protein